MTEHTESTSETVVEKPVLADPAEEKRVDPPAPVERTTETSETRTESGPVPPSTPTAG